MANAASASALEAESQIEAIALVAGLDRHPPFGVRGLVAAVLAVGVDPMHGAPEPVADLAQGPAGRGGQHDRLDGAGLVLGQQRGRVTDRGGAAFVDLARRQVGEGVGQDVGQAQRPGDPGGGVEAGLSQGEAELVGRPPGSGDDGVGADGGGFVAGAAVGELGDQLCLYSGGPAGEVFDPGDRIDQLGVVERVGVEQGVLDLAGQPGAGNRVGEAAVLGRVREPGLGDHGVGRPHAGRGLDPQRPATGRAVPGSRGLDCCEHVF